MRYICISLLASLSLSSCTSPREKPAGERTLASRPGPPISHPPGVTGSDLADLEHLSEGADIYPYEWMKALSSVAFLDENGEATRPFLQDLDKRWGMNRSTALKTVTEKGERRTYLVPYVGMSASWSNHTVDAEAEAYLEDQFPVVRDIRRNGESFKSIKMVGTNCTLCHSGSMSFQGKTFKVSGSPSVTDVRGFFEDLSRSTLGVLAKKDLLVQFLKKQNVADAEKHAKRINSDFLKRLGKETGIVNAGKLSAKITLAMAKLRQDTRRLYKGDHAITESLKDLLYVTYGFKKGDDIGELEQRMQFLGKLMVGTDPKTNETISGYARTDAFGRIGNLVLRGENPIDYTAPVSLPWVWGIKHMAMLHYNANSNSVAMRNVGQALGLGAVVLNKDMDSTVKVRNLDRLENLIHKIQVPNWRAIFAGIEELKVDEGMLGRGRRVYEAKCMKCHESNRFVGPAGQLRDYRVGSLEHVGTDRYAAVNATKPVDDNAFNATIFNSVGAIKNRYYETRDVTQSEVRRIEFADLRGAEFFRDTVKGFSSQNDYGNNYGDIEEGAGYKSRHLAGVWATAPYLHNGSVPTIWDLLSPASERPKLFAVGSIELDPRTLGFRHDVPKGADGKPDCKSKGKGYTCLNTEEVGNSNSGHEGSRYGTDLSVEDKRALIEYLKVLEPEPEYSWRD